MEILRVFITLQACLCVRSITLLEMRVFRSNMFSLCSIIDIQNIYASVGDEKMAHLEELSLEGCKANHN